MVMLYCSTPFIVSIFFNCARISVGFDQRLSREEIIKNIGLHKIFVPEDELSRAGMLPSRSLNFKFTSIEERDAKFTELHQGLSKAREEGLIKDFFKVGKRELPFGIVALDEGEIRIVLPDDGAEKIRIIQLLDSLKIMNNIFPNYELEYAGSGVSMNTSILSYPLVYLSLAVKDIFSDDIVGVGVGCPLE